ncbi:MAG TPA: DUF2145 domain-containing protein [Albitalea sp.]
MKSLRRHAVIAAALCALASIPVHAGTSCEQRDIGPAEVHKAMRMAYKTREFLERARPQVALVGRVGSNLEEHGLRYTHAGAILRDHPAGPWLFVHELNVCATDRSALFDEGLVNFYLDDLFAFEAVVIVPSPALQSRLLQVLGSPTANALHRPDYSMIANPFSVRYQNSNQWLLEVIAAALEPEGRVRDRVQAQEALARRGFQPDEIRVKPLQRLGAAFTRANVHFDDHDELESRSGRYRVVTVRSIVRFLERVDPDVKVTLIPLEGPVQPPTRY